MEIEIKRFLSLYKDFNIYQTKMLMGKRSIAEWIHHPKTNQILFSFSAPKTPKQVEKEVGIKKLKMKPLLEKRLVKWLNPKARKARFYILTDNARKLLKLSSLSKELNKNWDLIGWVMASPKQRIVVLKTVDSVKRTSEEIRERASHLNPNLSRISTKGILKELINKGLIETKLIERKRYYWISKKGKLVMDNVNCVKENKK